MALQNTNPDKNLGLAKSSETFSGNEHCFHKGHGLPMTLQEQRNLIFNGMISWWIIPKTLSTRKR